MNTLIASPSPFNRNSHYQGHDWYLGKAIANHPLNLPCLWVVSQPSIHIYIIYIYIDGWFMTLLYSSPSPSVTPCPFVPSSRRSLEHPDHFDQALHDDHLHLTVSQGLSEWMPNFHRWLVSPMFF